MVALQISVTRDQEGNSGLVLLDVMYVVYLEYDRYENGLMVHTLDDMFYTMGTLKYWTNALQNSGYQFAMVDRNVAVHLTKIKRLDSKYKIAYFETQITKDSKGCTVAWSHFNMLAKKLQSQVIIT
jgi:hypothetical protein